MIQKRKILGDLKEIVVRVRHNIYSIQERRKIENEADKLIGVNIASPTGYPQFPIY